MSEEKQLPYKVVAPNLLIEMEAKKIYTEEFQKGWKEGMIPRDRLVNELVKQGILDSDHEDKISAMQRELTDLLSPLKTGGIKKSEMVERAKKAQDVRNKIYNEISKRTKYDDLTIESRAEDARFKYLMLVCLQKQDGSRYFKSEKELVDCTDQEVLAYASNELTKFMYGDNTGFLQALPENKFLIEYGYMDENFEDLKAEKVEFVPFIDD